MKQWPLVLLGASLIGCATLDSNTRPIPGPDRIGSVTSYVRDLEQAIDDPRVVAWSHALPTVGGGAGFREEPQFRSNFVSGCSVSPEFQSIESFYLEFEKVCSAHSGVFNRSLCIDQSDPDRVLFVLRAENHACSEPGVGRFGFMISAIEPKPGFEKSEPYIARLQREGFRTRAQLAVIDADQKAKARRAEALVEQDRVRVERERPLLRERGTRVCRQDGIWFYQGFVEDSTDRKLQIRVSSVERQYYGSGLRAGGFEADRIIWDSIERWRLCE